MGTFLSELAEHGSLLIDNDSIYLISGSPDGNSNISFPDTPEVNLGLIRAGSVNQLTKFNSVVNQLSIEKLKREYIEEVFSGEYVMEAGRDEIITHRRTLHFIINELMPFMSGLKEEVWEVLEGAAEVEKEKEEVKKANANKPVDEREMLERFVALEAKTREKLIAEGRKTFGENMDSPEKYIRNLCNNTNNPIVLHEGGVYILNDEIKGKERVSIKRGLDTKVYSPKLCLASNEYLDCFERFMNWNIKLGVLGEFHNYAKEIQKTFFEKNDKLNDAMKLKEFSDGDIGFLHENGRLWIYHHISPFAMLDPRPQNKDICYKFPKCRVGLQISYERKGRVCLYEPCLFEAIWHPFVSDNDIPFQKLCGGTIPDRGKFSSDVEFVAKALDDAKNLVMQGLTPKSIVRHGGDRGNGGRYFGISLDVKLEPHKISVDDAKKEGLVITNKWEWDQQNE